MNSEMCKHELLIAIAYPSKDGELWDDITEYVTTVKNPLSFATVCASCKTRIDVRISKPLDATLILVKKSNFSIIE